MYNNEKNYFLLVVLFQLVQAQAFDTTNIFGFKQQSDPQNYQQYVGQSFFVRPAYGTLETWKRSGFDYRDVL